jgi:hypothetical protein
MLAAELRNAQRISHFAFHGFGKRKEVALGRPHPCQRFFANGRLSRHDYPNLRIISTAPDRMSAAPFPVRHLWQALPQDSSRIRLCDAGDCRESWRLDVLRQSATGSRGT